MSALPDNFRIETLGWGKMFPQAVVEAMLRVAPEMDFTGTALVVPGGRAGRRILALLTDEAAARKLAMVPPKVTTPGALVKELVEFTLPLAGPLARRSAWARALVTVGPGVRGDLFPRPPALSDFAAWFRLAGLLEQTQRDLAGAGYSFSQVAERAGRGMLGDPARWRAAAEIEQAYIQELALANVADEQYERNRAIVQNRLKLPRRIVVAGVAQLTPQTRAALDTAVQRGTDLQVLIFAPEELRDRFDNWGCVLPERWSAARLPIERARVRIAEGPRDVAQAVFRAIAELPAPPRADEITIGVLSEPFVPFIEAEAAVVCDVPVRYGVGKLLSATRPYRVLSLAADFLEGHRFRHLQALVRHPDVQRYLSTRWKQSYESIEPEWLRVLDEYAGKFFPDILEGSAAEPTGWRTGDEHSGRDDLAWLYREMCTFTDAGGDPEELGTLPALAAKIVTPLLYAFGASPWDQARPDHLVIVHACQRLRESLQELHDHEVALDQTQVTHAEAVRILLDLSAADRAVPRYTGAEIDLMGWLELMPDDAAHVVVAGFNEGLVPESSRVDSFLTNTVRKALGLADDAERYARDAYLLSALLSSRPEKSVTLIAARFSAEDDPMLPSRLLFAGDPAELPERVMQFAKPKAAGTRLAYKVRAGIGLGEAGPFGKVYLPPAEKIEVPVKMSVTSFGAYVKSPLGFYLEHIHNGGLETIEQEAPRELPVMDFGSLVHGILHEALTPAASQGTPSVREWEDRLMEALRRRVQAEYGDALSATLRFQVALLEKRFAAVAAWQHEWRKEGWRIHRSEWSAEKPVALDVDGKPMFLTGRIDRIDRNEKNGEFAVLDYKVCKGDKKPPGPRGGGGWSDFQLPLYTLLAREVTGDPYPKLGYVRVSDEPQAVGVALARWRPEEIADAIEAARAIVRKIRNREFSAVGDDPPTHGAFASIFGEGILSEEDEDDGGESGGGE